MKKYFDENLEIVKKSIDSIDIKMFEQLLDECVNTLNLGKKIIVSGLGKNVPICDKFMGEMLSLGQNAMFMHTNSAVHGDIGAVCEDDVVIILTKSGETAESVYLYEHLLKKKANIWLLSFANDSTLANKIDKKIILDLEHEGDDWNIVPNNSSIVNMIVLQSLAINIARKRNFKLEQFKMNHPGGHIGELLK
ncbi:MAG: SIS domain-containing protein [Bacilli bacterium]|nr:SIS domain-containing protein [Bacilli bacterium]